MANNKLNLASIQANKLIAELFEKREKTQVQFRSEISESQKRVNYQMNPIDYKVLND